MICLKHKALYDGKDYYHILLDGIMPPWVWSIKQCKFIWVALFRHIDHSKYFTYGIQITISETMWMRIKYENIIKQN